MKRTSFSRWPCSIARTMDILGDWWTPLILREAFYGIRRFDDFQLELGIARNTLIERLNRLVADGLFEKKLYQERPPRYEYELTPMGEDIFPVLAALSRWGDTWLAGEDGPPIVLHHSTCGHDTHAQVTCVVCGVPLASGDTSMRMGPGYPPRLARRPEVQRRFAAMTDEGSKEPPA